MNFKTLERLLMLVLPVCFVCPECGPVVKADEDGCCAMCGRDTKIFSTHAALMMKKRRKAR